MAAFDSARLNAAINLADSCAMRSSFASDHRNWREMLTVLAMARDEITRLAAELHPYTVSAHAPPIEQPNLAANMANPLQSLAEGKRGRPRKISLEA